MTRNRWDEFAQENAEYYILTTNDLDYSTPSGMASFFESGRREAARILDEAGGHLTAHHTALEIGCGVGRLAIPMARTFDRVIGVDISPTMLAKLAENTRDAQLSNVTGFLAGEPWDKQGPVDFAYSRIVFQHIEDWEVIEDNVTRIASCLADRGIASLHFDTRPRSLAYEALRIAPDKVLRRQWRRGIRRVRRSAADVEALLRQHGLRVVTQLRPGTELHVFIAARHT